MSDNNWHHNICAFNYTVPALPGQHYSFSSKVISWLVLLSYCWNRKSKDKALWQLDTNLGQWGSLVFSFHWWCAWCMSVLHSKPAQDLCRPNQGLGLDCQIIILTAAWASIAIPAYKAHLCDLRGSSSNLLICSGHSTGHAAWNKLGLGGPTTVSAQTWNLRKLYDYEGEQMSNGLFQLNWPCDYPFCTPPSNLTCRLLGRSGYA